MQIQTSLVLRELPTRDEVSWGVASALRCKGASLLPTISRYDGQQHISRLSIPIQFSPFFRTVNGCLQIHMKVHVLRSAELLLCCM